jgi:hypothetical protein
VLSRIMLEMRRVIGKVSKLMPGIMRVISKEIIILCGFDTKEDRGS